MTHRNFGCDRILSTCALGCIDSNGRFHDYFFQKMVFGESKWEGSITEEERSVYKISRLPGQPCISLES